MSKQIETSNRWLDIIVPAALIVVGMIMTIICSYVCSGDQTMLDLFVMLMSVQLIQIPLILIAMFLLAQYLELGFGELQSAILKTVGIVFINVPIMFIGNETLYLEELAYGISALATLGFIVYLFDQDYWEASMLTLAYGFIEVGTIIACKSSGLIEEAYF